MSERTCRLTMQFHGLNDQGLTRNIDEPAAAKECFESICRKMVNDYQGTLRVSRVFSRGCIGQRELVEQRIYIVRLKYLNDRYDALVELVSPK